MPQTNQTPVVREVDLLYCRHCNAQLDSVNYEVENTEYGWCELDLDDEHLYAVNHECDRQDDYGDYRHYCPECNHELSLSNITETGNADLRIERAQVPENPRLYTVATDFAELLADETDDSNADEDNLVENLNCHSLGHESTLIADDGHRDYYLINCPHCHGQKYLDVNEPSELDLINTKRREGERDVDLGDYVCPHCRQLINLKTSLVTRD